MKPYLKMEDLWLTASLAGWDGSSGLHNDFGQAALRNAAVLAMREVMRRPVSGNYRPWLKAMGSRLAPLVGISFEAMLRYPDLYVEHPHLAWLRTQMIDFDLRRILRSGNLERIAPQLEQMRKTALEGEVKNAVRRFEDKQKKREDRFRREARSVVKNRPWMTVLWVRLAMGSPASTPPGVNIRQLKKALTRLTKGHQERWPTCFAYAVGLGHQHDQGGYFADVVFFFDADEERHVEDLAKVMSGRWETSSDGWGKFRVVGGFRRLYVDEFRPESDPSLYTEEELQTSVNNILQYLAERDSQLHLEGVGRVYRLTPIRVPKNRDHALPSSVAAKVAGMPKSAFKSRGKTQVFPALAPDYSFRYGLSDVQVPMNPAPEKVPSDPPREAAPGTSGPAAPGTPESLALTTLTPTPIKRSIGRTTLEVPSASPSRKVVTILVKKRTPPAQGTQVAADI